MTDFAWEERDPTLLFLPKSGSRPAMVVYCTVSRRWCWDLSDTLFGKDAIWNNRLPSEALRTGFWSREAARHAVEQWLRECFPPEGQAQQENSRIYYQLGRLSSPGPDDPFFEMLGNALSSAATCSNHDSQPWGIWNRDTLELLFIVYRGLAYQPLGEIVELQDGITKKDGYS